MHKILNAHLRLRQCNSAKQDPRLIRSVIPFQIQIISYLQREHVDGIEQTQTE